MTKLASETHFDGFLYSKLHAIGSKTEGPSYFLQTFHEKDIPIVKHTSMWQEDPALQSHIATKVTIEGTLQDGSLKYTAVKPYRLPLP